MKRVFLGESDVEVSAWCLGTMTFGRQTEESDGHREIEAAIDAGITYLDCAEMYPVNPVLAETVGDSERILGNWIGRPGNREKVEVATKVTGPNKFIRDGKGYDGGTVSACIDASLERLQTDHIDLYQLHWPNRGSYHFRQNWSYNPPSNRDEVRDNMIDVLEALEDARKAGKIRAFGLSNDTVWGTAEWLRLAEAGHGPRVASMQNEYSLLCRLYDTDFAEMSAMENIPLFAYSPLAAGLLTGKYAGGSVPEGSRAAKGGDLGGRMTDAAHDAVDAYLKLAQKHDVDPVHMAIAFVAQRPFPSIPIIGATTPAQLDHLIAGTDVVLSDELLSEIDDLHKQHPMPY